MTRSERARSHVFLLITSNCLRVAYVSGNAVDDAFGEVVLRQRTDVSPALFFGQPARIDPWRQTAQGSRHGHSPLYLHCIKIGFGNRANRVLTITDKKRALAAGCCTKIAGLESHWFEDYIIACHQSQCVFPDVRVFIVKNTQNIFCQEELRATLRYQLKKFPKEVIADIGN